MVSVLDSGFEPWPWSLCCVLRQDTSVIFLCVLRGGLSLVCYGEVSVQRESTVHLKYNLHLLFY